MKLGQPYDPNYQPPLERGDYSTKVISSDKPISFRYLQNGDRFCMVGGERSNVYYRRIRTKPDGHNATIDYTAQYFRFSPNKEVILLERVVKKTSFRIKMAGAILLFIFVFCLTFFGSLYFAGYF